MARTCKSLLVPLLLPILAGMGLAACGPGFAVHPDLRIGQNPEFTGGLTADGRLHTAGSDDGEVQRLKDRVDPTQDENSQLSAAIHQFRLTPLDEKNQPVTGSPKKIRAEILLESYPQSLKTNLVFTGALRRTNGTLEVAMTAEGRNDFVLSLLCRDVDCLKSVMVLKHLESSTSQKSSRLLAEAALVHRRNPLTVKAEVASQERPRLEGSAALKRVADDYQSTQSQPVLITEVAWGRSFFRIPLLDGKLCVSGSLVQTTEVDETLQIACDETPMDSSIEFEGASVRLIGNTQRGEMVLRLEHKGAVLFLLLAAPEAKPTAPAPQSPSAPAPVPNPIAGDGFLPAHAQSIRWEADRSQPDVQSYIATWQMKKAERVRSFLANAAPRRAEMLAGFARYDIPPEMMFITLIESNYFIHDGYGVEVNTSSTATGPWQFLDGTAKWLGLRIRPARVQNGRKTADPCDERINLGRSTEAAAKYFRLLFDMFPEDPKLAVMGYNWGQGKVGDLVKCLKNEGCAGNDRVRHIRQSGLDFWAVKRFHMAPQDKIDYVLKFVSAQFVGREPKRYGFENPASSGAVAPEIVNAGLCN